MLEKRKAELKIEAPIIYFDEYRRSHHALVQAVHGVVSEHEGKMSIPCINLVFLSASGDKTDQYGRQIEHDTSCSHVSDQYQKAGRYWCFPDEEGASQPDESVVATQK